MRKPLTVAFGLVVAAALSACAQVPPPMTVPGSAQSTPAASPTPPRTTTPKVTATPRPSATPATGTPTATATRSATAGSTPTATPTPTQKASATGSPSPSPRPSLPGQKWVGDDTAGWMAVPADWQDCSAGSTFGICDGKLGYKAAVDAAPAAAGVTAEQYAQGLLTTYQINDDCEDEILVDITKNGHTVYQVSAMCQGQELNNVIDTGAAPRLFKFTGPGGVAFDAYYQPIWSTYSW